MTRAHDAHVDGQFGPQAQAYVQSPVHAGGAALDALSEIAARVRPAVALDLGCGGGHVAYRLSPHAGRVVACDLSADMLAAVAATATARDLQNIDTERAAAEALPFEAASFDLLACRFSAHHWRDFEAGLREARRVLRPGAPAVFIDGCSPGDPLLDTHLQAVEVLRDTSHVRDYSAGEWTAALARCGFVAETVSTWRLRMDFDSWTARMRTPPHMAAAIRALQASVSAEVRAAFEIEADGSFQLDVLMIEARAGRAASAAA